MTVFNQQFSMVSSMAGEIDARIQGTCKQLEGSRRDYRLGVVTISIGVSGGGVARGRDPEWFVKEADRALYHAKEGGRNCVALSSHCPPEPGEPHQCHSYACQPQHDPVQFTGQGA